MGDKIRNTKKYVIFGFNEVFSGFSVVLVEQINIVLYEVFIGFPKKCFGEILALFLVLSVR